TTPTSRITRSGLAETVASPVVRMKGGSGLPSGGPCAAKNSGAMIGSKAATWITASQKRIRFLDLLCSSYDRNEGSLSDALSRQHFGPPSGDRPAVPEPSHAERARTMMQSGGLGTLSTHSRKHPGFPFGSVMPFGADQKGRPVFLISSMAIHTQNL